MFVVATGISYSFSESRRDGMFPGHTMSSLRVGEGKKGGRTFSGYKHTVPPGLRRKNLFFRQPLRSFNKHVALASEDVKEKANSS